MYVNIFIYIQIKKYAMNQCNPRIMVDNYQNTETTLKMLHFSLVSGFWGITRTI